MNVSQHFVFEWSLGKGVEVRDEQEAQWLRSWVGDLTKPQ
jgi:hypothetical protein